MTSMKKIKGMIWTKSAPKRTTKLKLEHINYSYKMYNGMIKNSDQEKILIDEKRLNGVERVYKTLRIS